MLRETWVEPDRLFDARSESPPADAVDLVFPAPTSLSLFADAVSQTSDLSHQLDRLAEIYEWVTEETARDVQRYCGYVTHPRSGDRTPARLAVAGLAENTFHGNSGESIPRIHAHLYVGRTAPALRDGLVCDVTLDRLRRTVDRAWVGYLHRLIDVTTEEFGLVWDTLSPDHHPGDREIVRPPFAEFVPQHPIPNEHVCPGKFGPHEQILADQQWRIAMGESLLRSRAERHRDAG